VDGNYYRDANRVVSIVASNKQEPKKSTEVKSKNGTKSTKSQ
jgi:hypothetical protein